MKRLNNADLLQIIKRCQHRRKMKVNQSRKKNLLTVFTNHTGSQCQSQVASRQQEFIKREGFRNTDEIIAIFLADGKFLASPFLAAP